MPERRFSLSLPAQVRAQTERYLSDLHSHLASITTPCKPKPLFFPWSLGLSEEFTRLPVGGRIDQEIKSRRLENMVAFFDNVRDKAKLGISPFGHLSFRHQFFDQKWKTRFTHRNKLS
jgi:hypothetical protein